MRDQKPRSVLGIVFLTVFLDIVGFSVLFPLFPALLDHYLALEGDASAVGRIVAYLEELAGTPRQPDRAVSFAVVTLFGGLLGSVYSVLQFVFSTVWGGLSDRIGRRRTLLFTLAGTVTAYALWVFAGRFSLLVLSRVLAGAMAGNIATASAAVADTTDGRRRAAGMGMVGMAIGLGFVLGPALGGLSAGIHLAEPVAEPGVLALNPFSFPALCSLVMALVNLLWVATRFPETLRPEARGASPEQRTLHPFRRLATLDFPGVKRTNVIYLLYFVVFSAMEFTLVFLAAERFHYGPAENAAMFVFVGLVIALVQGGVVRRMAPKRGEKPLALAGLCLTLPGLLLVGAAETSQVGLYAGLFLMAVGSALASPCLSALVSRYTPEDRQGLAQGVLRSMGSLARAVGPLLGAGLYWRFGSAAPYLAGAACLVAPIALARSLPPVPPQPAPEAGSAPAGA